jgi:hypothetical protein
MIESSEYEKVFLMLDWRRILRLLADGSRIMAVSILLLVSAALLLVVVPIYWLLMILTQNKMLLSPTVLESHYEWYTSGPRQRLQPGGAIVLVMTRWSVKDLTGKLLEAQGKE